MIVYSSCLGRGKQGAYVRVAHVIVDSLRSIQHYVVQYTLRTGSRSTTNFINLRTCFKCYRLTEESVQTVDSQTGMKIFNKKYNL